MNSPQHQLERIVAYLDGELSAEESAQVEQQLAADNDFRQQLQGAERAWQALDELPMAHVGNDFSRTTMEMVVDAARQDVEAQTVAMPVQRRKRKAATAVLATMAVLLGALTVRVAGNSPNRRLVADLPVIHHVDIYSQFKTAEFLRQLDNQLGDDLETSEAEAEQIEAKLVEHKRVSATADRESWLESLSSDQQVALRAKFNRFRDLSPEQQAELRALHQQIDTADDREPLLQTMFRYQLWLNELTPGDQYEIRKEQSDPDNVKNVAREMRRAARDQEFKLSKQELDDLFKGVMPFIEKVVERNQGAFGRRMSQRPQRHQEWFKSLPQRKQAMFVFISAVNGSQEQFREFHESVAVALPSEMQTMFRQLPQPKQRDLLFGWFRQYQSQTTDGKRLAGITEQELADYFVEHVRSEDKERLLALPRDEMLRQLQRLYFGQSGRRPWQRQRDMDGRPRHPGDGPPPEGGWGERRGERRGPRPGGPRGEPGVDGQRDGPPPRRIDGDGPRRRGPDGRRRPADDRGRPDGPPPPE